MEKFRTQTMNEEATIFYRYDIRPRLNGDGYILSGPAFRFGGLWYSDLHAAISHALQIGRAKAKAGELRVFGLNGVVTMRQEWKADGKFL